METNTNATNVQIASIALNLANVLLVCVEGIFQEVYNGKSVFGSQEIVAVSEQLEIHEIVPVIRWQYNTQELQLRGVIRAISGVILGFYNPIKTTQKNGYNGIILSWVKV